LSPSMPFVASASKTLLNPSCLRSHEFVHITKCNPALTLRTSWKYPSRRTMSLGLTQPLTQMSTRNLPGGKGRPARKVDNLTVICEPNV
jgi:hypothetical protein